MCACVMGVASMYVYIIYFHFNITRPLYELVFIMMIIFPFPKIFLMNIYFVVPCILYDSDFFRLNQPYS